MQIAVKMSCFIQLRFQLVIRPSLALRIKAVKERVLGLLLRPNRIIQSMNGKNLTLAKTGRQRPLTYLL